MGRVEREFGAKLTVHLLLKGISEVPKCQMEILHKNCQLYFKYNTHHNFPVLVIRFILIAN
jgi:hypothetical protein